MLLQVLFHGASGDTELFEKASNINGFQGGRVANNLYISPFRATVFQTAALFLYPNSSAVIGVENLRFLSLWLAFRTGRGCFPIREVAEAYRQTKRENQHFSFSEEGGAKMAVFRIEKTRDYTVMSNYHLRDMSLSLKAKGLLSLMLSLPENWDYTMKGLARICKDGIDSISGGIRELEAHGYLIRSRVRSANGQLGSIEYTILEQPKAPSPTQEKPIRENPVQANPMLAAPIQENPAQLNKEESSNYPSKTDLSITQESSPILSSPPAPRERSGQDGMRKRESYRALILENIEYDVLSQNVQLDKDRLDELVELMVDTVCSNREMIRVAGDNYPAEVVRSRFLKLNASHIEYVLDRMRENTTYVRNIKKYLLAALYNAPVTMDSYYTSLVSHDLYGSGDRR